MNVRRLEIAGIIVASLLAAAAAPIDALDSKMTSEEVEIVSPKTPDKTSNHTIQSGEEVKRPSSQPVKDSGTKKNNQTPKPVKPTVPAKNPKPDDKDPVVQVGDFTDILVLVNKTHHISADKVPADLTKPKVKFGSGAWNKLMRVEAASALEDLFTRAATDDLTLLAVSGYRSYQTQAAIFASRASQVGETQANRTSARAGQSEHQTGLAMDVTCPAVDQELSQYFGSTEEGKWVAKNAAESGFIIRYPLGKESITGYSYEPWHLRYVGIEAALAISSDGLTLEEYLNQRK
ncbi:MAG: D-alanyl-D-alanine carboxypeptidase family protein [Ignavibacteriales bacterium]